MGQTEGLFALTDVDYREPGPADRTARTLLFRLHSRSLKGIYFINFNLPLLE
jgi:hypothetical protein